jgi:hypothetical protein
MKPEAIAPAPPNPHTIILTDPIPLAAWVPWAALLIGCIVLIWAVWSGWKCRDDGQKSGTRKRVLMFCSILLLLVGTVACLWNIATQFFCLAQVSRENTVAISMFSVCIAQALYHYIIFVIASGTMFLISFTMPWKRKHKGNPQPTPAGDVANRAAPEE